MDGYTEFSSKARACVASACSRASAGHESPAFRLCAEQRALQARWRQPVGWRGPCSQSRCRRPSPRSACRTRATLAQRGQPVTRRRRRSWSMQRLPGHRRRRLSAGQAWGLLQSLEQEAIEAVRRARRACVTPQSERLRVRRGALASARVPNNSLQQTDEVHLGDVLPLLPKSYVC